MFPTLLCSRAKRGCSHLSTGRLVSLSGLTSWLKLASTMWVCTISKRRIEIIKAFVPERQNSLIMCWLHIETKLEFCSLSSCISFNVSKSFSLLLLLGVPPLCHSPSFEWESPNWNMWNMLINTILWSNTMPWSHFKMTIKCDHFTNKVTKEETKD